MKTLLSALMTVGLLCITHLMLSGCMGTVAPTIKGGEVASPSGDVANSGIIGKLPNNAREVDAHYLARYQDYVAKGWGKYLSPPLLTADGIKPYGKNYAIDYEHRIDFNLMRDLSDNGLPSKK